MTFVKKPLAMQVVLATLATSMATMGQPVFAQGDTMLEEVLVTARKKEESLQDVPVAVSAVTSSLIEDLNLQSLSDISKVTAGLVYDDDFGRNSNRPVIRGQANILGSSGVSFFIDGVYVTGTLGGYDLNDLERVEVVKGPQSALYGRNTYSGAINLITKSPGDEFSSDVKLEVAQDEQYEVAASVRGPLIPGLLSGGVTGRYYTRGGPFTNEYDGSDIGEQESQSVSGVLEFTPTENLQIRARAYYSDLEDGQIAMFSQPASANNCFEDNGSLYQGLGRYYCGELVAQPVSTDYSRQIPDAHDGVESLQTSLNIDWSINDFWSLTAITGYNSSDEVQKIDGDYDDTSFQVANFTPNGFPYDGFPVPPFDYAYAGSMVDFSFSSAQETSDFSQELRLNFDGDKLRAMVGAYYFEQTEDNSDTRDLPEGAAGLAMANYLAELGAMQAVCAANPVCGTMVPFFGPNVVVARSTNDFEIENKALFGLVSWDFTDSLTLTAEGRYQEEDIKQHAVIQDLGQPVSSVVDADASFETFSPRVTLDWRLNDNSMLYVLYAEGTKPGGFNSALAIEAGLPTYDEEEVESFEIGAKNVFDDGRMIVNLSAFFNDLSGYQLTQNVRVGANTQSATVNAGDAEIMGLEAEFSWRPAAVEGLTLRSNYAWTDSEFVDGTDENQGVLNDVADDGLVNCSTGNQFPDSGECTSIFGSIEGKAIPRTAEHQFFFDAEYARPLEAWDGWNWRVGADYAYESSKFAQVHNLLETGDTSLVNARLGVYNERYSLTFWGKNLTGEDTPTLALRYADGNDSFKRSFVGMSRRDTYFGATFTAHF